MNVAAVPFQYQQITSEVLAYIERKNLRPGDRLPPEREFSELFSVGRPTVNKALACLIAEGRLRREGYKLYVASPSKQETPSISLAVLCPHPLNRKKMITHTLIEAAHDICELSKTRFTPMLSIDGEQQRFQLIDLLKNPPSGIVIWPHVNEHFMDLFTQIRTRNIALVVNDLDFGMFDFVGVDNYRGIQSAAEHLSGLGHKEVAYFTRKRESSNVAQRAEAYEHAAIRLFSKASVTRVYELQEEDDKDFDQVFGRFRKEASRVTAVLCSHDSLALKIMDSCRDVGICVPDALSIAGFDGIDASATSAPSLTTAAQDFYQMGALAVELAIRRIRMRHIAHAQAPQKIRLSPQLIIRDSTKAPRSKPKLS